MSPIQNPSGVTLAALLPSLQRRYPTAAMKKPFLSPEVIMVPVENYKMMVRAQPKRSRLLVDFTPPVLWSIIGMLGAAFLVSFILSMLLQTLVFGFGALIVLGGFFITKAIFKSRKKAEMDTFHADVQRAVQPEEGSIF